MRVKAKILEIDREFSHFVNCSKRIKKTRWTTQHVFTEAYKIFLMRRDKKKWKRLNKAAEENSHRLSYNILDIYPRQNKTKN